MEDQARDAIARFAITKVHIDLAVKTTIALSREARSQCRRWKDHLTTTTALPLFAHRIDHLRRAERVPANG